jgi:hypothetical protein
VIKADTTIVDDARNIIFASGRASFFSPGGGLKTDRIAWDRNVDEITAMGKVTLTRDGSVLWGKNLRTNSKLSFAEMEAVSAEGIVNEKTLIGSLLLLILLPVWAQKRNDPEKFRLIHSDKLYMSKLIAVKSWS